MARFANCSAACDRRRAWLTALALITGGVLFALIESVELRLAHASRPHHDEYPVLFVRLLPPWLILALLGVAVALLTPRFEPGGLRPLRTLALHVGAAAMFPVASLSLLALYHSLFGLTQLSLSRNLRQLLGSYYVFHLAMYLLIAAVCHAATFLRDARERARREGELRSTMAQARLAALREQLRPHFLFNAMNTISMLVRAGERDAAVNGLASLGSLLRASLHEGARHEVPLAEELAVVRDYLAIEQARFGERLRVAFDVPDELQAAPVPSWLLQPLVENAVRHGIARSSQPGRIEIAARRRARVLEVSVSNDGPDPAAGSLDAAVEHGHGIGLTNLRARLQALYHGAGSLRLVRGAGGGAMAIAELPWRPAGAETRR